MAGRSRALRGAVLRRNRTVLVVGLCVAGVGMLGAAVAAVMKPPLIGMGISVGIFALMITFALWRGNVWPSRREGAIEAGNDGIRLDGELVVARDALSRGQIRRRHGVPPRVQLYDRHNRLTLEIEVATDAKGRSLLARAHLDPAHAASEFILAWHRLGQPAVVVPLTFLPVVILGPSTILLGKLLAMLGVPDGSVIYPLVMGGALVAMASGAVALYRGSRTHLRAGPDGINVRRFGRDRFVRHDQVAVVERWPAKHNTVSEGFDIVLKDGSRIKLRTTTQRAYQGDMWGDFIADAVTRAAEAHRRSSTGQDLVVLQRGHREVSEWVTALKGMGGDEGMEGYRAVSPPREVLWQLVKDPGAGAVARAAGAVVLCGRDDDQACRRIRLMADAVARPALRAAMLAAAADDQRALERALATLTV